MRTTLAAPLFLAITGALFWIGCGSDEVSRASSKRPGTSTSDVTETNSNTPTPTPVPGSSLSSLEPAEVAIPADIDIQPTNGKLFQTERTSSVSIHFTGFTEAAGEKVEVQVLSTPGAEITEANWTTIATTTSAATATATAPIFRYDVEAVPGASNRWRAGGVVRFRTVVTDAGGKRTLLPFFDRSSGACIKDAGQKDWKEVIALCKSPFSPALGAELGSTKKAGALVSSSVQPEDVFFPDFLSRRGFINANETDAYYDNVNAPRTLDEFRFRFGFDTKSEVDANYYNLGDLGIGREMHCTTFDRNGQSGTACYVRNYGVRNDGVGDFSGNPDRAMNDLLRGRDSFAAVCMVKFGTTLADPNGNDVQFFVYDANERIANRAQLDSFASNDAIPNNCLNCHGGKYERGVITGSTFLPFDPEAFRYANEDGFTFDDQKDEIRALNDMMKNAGAPPTTKQYIDGMYAGKSNVAGTQANLDFIPAGWAVSEEAKTVYREVYKPYCRTCHTSQIGEFAFMTYDDYKAAAAKSMHSVCDTQEMPLAEATMIQFWNSPARAYLLNSLDSNASCAPRGQ